MKRILIVKTSAIGDVITTLDVLGYLKTRFPLVKVDWVVERPGAGLLLAHPEIDRVFICDTKKWRKALFKKEIWDEIRAFFKELKQQEYDIVFDVQGNIKSALFTGKARAKNKVGFSFKTVAEKPNCLVTNLRYAIPKKESVRKRYLSLVQAYFGDKGEYHPYPVAFKLNQDEKQRLLRLPKGRKILIAFGSHWKNKKVPQEILEDVLRRVDGAMSPHFIFPYGSPAEKEAAEALARPFNERGHVVGEMSLPLYQAVIGKMDGMLTVDSAALHLGGTTETPMVSVFGPSLASVYQPERRDQVALQGRCPYGEVFLMRCKRLRTCPTGACMQAYLAQEIAQKLISLSTQSRNVT